MTEQNEPSFRAGSVSDKTAGHMPRLKQASAVPSWRFRPTRQAVVQTFRDRIIPKLVLALRSLPTVTGDDAAREEIGTIAAFADLAVGLDDDAAFAHVGRLMAEGQTAESILLDLLAPTARHLGTLWETDATDFVTVTLGVSRLQRIMRRLGETFFDERHPVGSGDAVLLTIVPGEQHSFGLSMVAEFFRREGWNLCSGPFASHQELTSLVQNHWFDIVGFSVSSDRRLDELRQDIGAIRRDSRNRDIGIMLGGPMVVLQPDVIAAMGADLLSTDAASAPQQARGLIQRMTNG